MEALAEHFQCGVCLETFDSTMHIPRTLNCGHTYCGECIGGLNKSASAQCPSCKRDLFPINYQLMGMAEVNRVNSELVDRSSIQTNVYVSEQLRKVVLFKNEHGLGFKIVGGFELRGKWEPIYIKCVELNGIAGLSGQVREGDILLSVNGISLHAVPHAKAAECITKATNPVTLELLYRPLDLVEFDQRMIAQLMSDWKTNESDQALIKATWSEDFETLYLLGSKMYLQIFAQDGTIKALFPWIAQYEKAGRDFTLETEFRTQALRLVTTIAKVVENLPHLKGLDAHLYKLGHRHVKYLSNALKPLYWVAFQDAMQSVITEKMKSLTKISETDRARAIEIWKDVVVYVNNNMKAGYEDGLKGIDKYPTGMF